MAPGHLPDHRHTATVSRTHGRAATGLPIPGTPTAL